MRWVLSLLLVVFITGHAMAKAPPLSQADAAEVERLRQYLNGLTTLEAKFQQLDARGNVATGRFWLHRPNRLRFEYDPPNPILIVARGSFLVHFDKELKETHYLDQDETPAWFLLSKEVRFGENVIVQGVQRDGDRIGVTAQQVGREDEGAITLIFQHSPIKLLGWTMVDAGGNQVYLTLLNQTLGGPIDPDLFEFRPTDYD
jgi:outer membrane lipoprotein-sorting protein